MIGVFDSGHGGLTVFRALSARFPQVPFVYLGDHANVPYGDRPSDEIVALTRDGVEALFRRGCKLVRSEERRVGKEDGEGGGDECEGCGKVRETRGNEERRVM